MGEDSGEGDYPLTLALSRQGREDCLKTRNVVAAFLVGGYKTDHWVPNPIVVGPFKVVRFQPGTRLKPRTTFGGRVQDPPLRG